ncbi:MAG: hypothetical protein ABIN67_16950 [Ferruginibacter sp.]
MKIIFFCGSLEPGRDGVGDYTRRLAGEMIRKGHQAGIVALNDQYFVNEFDGVQESEDVIIPVLRLSLALDFLQRLQRAKLWVDKINPEWLSLQFVPFAFHRKGLPFEMYRIISKIGKGRRWHIMVHELWVGMNQEAPLKFVYWGWLQKRLIKSFFEKLRPEVINTQTRLYVKMLAKIGFKAHYLPLFANIPMTSKLPESSDELIKYTDVEGMISLVVFGGIHPGAPIKQLAEELKLYSVATGTKIKLKMIGRCGSEQLRWEQEVRAAGLIIELFGEQPPERISEVLSNSSFGISTTPAQLIEKSGSVAAMQEHKLPILCVSRSWHPRGISDVELSPGVIQYKPGVIHSFMAVNVKSSQHKSISYITDKFTANLLAI